MIYGIFKCRILVSQHKGKIFSGIAASDGHKSIIGTHILLLASSWLGLVPQSKMSKILTAALLT